MKTKIISYLAIGLIACSVSFFAVFSYHHLTKSPKRGSSPGAESIVHFHADAVKKLSWTFVSNPQLNRVWTRESRRVGWSPATDSSQIQDKLNLLSLLPVQKMAPIKHPDSIWELEFAPGNSWRGVSDGERFVWTTGSLAGTGARLDDDGMNEMKQGKFSFEDREFGWCQSRPQRIEFKKGGLHFELRSEHGGWVMGRKASRFSESFPEQTKLDATEVERWLGHNCTQHIDAFRDLATYPLPLGFDDGYLDVTFRDGKRIRLPFRSNFLFISSQQAILAPNLIQGLEGLSGAAFSASFAK